LEKLAACLACVLRKVLLSMALPVSTSLLTLNNHNHREGYEIMSAKNSSAPVASANTTVDALQETLKKVEASLLPTVDSFCSAADVGTKNKKDETTEKTKPSALGLDFLHVKNTLLLSYLIDLTVHLRDTVDPILPDDEESKEEEESTLQQQKEQQQHRRLIEMRTVLDKSRGLDKKLRYQIEKLLSSLTNSSSYATGGDNTKDSEDDDDDDDDNNNNRQQFGTKEDDPLKYRPDPKSMLDDDDDDDDDDNDSSNDDDSNDDDEESEDEDLAAARATMSFSKQAKSKKKKGDEDDSDDDDEGKSSKKYIAPRMTAVPYTHDVADKQKEKDTRQRRKLRSTELAQTLRQQYGDQPDTEDVFGGGNSEFYGKQRTAAKAVAQREADILQFEESTMTRFTTSRKDKKEKKRVERMMEGGTNLASIANLGNLVRETQAFGRSGNNSDDEQYGEEEALKEYMSGVQNNKNKSNDDDDDDGGSNKRHASGKRRRDAVTENRKEGAGRRLKNGKNPKAYNSLQAALYGSGDVGGGGGSGGKSSKSNKKKSRR
jgi:U3 small nucleolar ribonucleoprotein protein LCP5